MCTLVYVVGGGPCHAWGQYNADMLEARNHVVGGTERLHNAMTLISRVTTLTWDLWALEGLEPSDGEYQGNHPRRPNEDVCILIL